MYARLRCGGNLPQCERTRYQKQAFTVRKGHSVHENPLFLHGRRFQRNSVLKIGFYGTEEIFGAKNSLLWYATHFRKHSV